MSTEIQEIIDAVDNINALLYDQLGPETTAVLTYTYSTYAQWIEWNGEQIWSSEDDEREWEEKDYAANGKCIEAGYEPMEPFLRKKVNQVIAEVKKIKL